jgi:UDP-N-acetylmuramoyl-L-alanyl-D-glutamate--2,6-diaminopimelate ligase
MNAMEWWKAVPGKTAGTLPEVGGLSVDSRRVAPGWAFVAVPGSASDGHDYLDNAVANGATALVVQSDRAKAWQHLQRRVPLLILENTRAAAGPLAAAVYGHPSHQLRLIGITGTDGKTTSSHLTAHVLNRCGLKAGYLSSVGFETGEGFEPNESHMTTLEAPVVQANLARAVAVGLETMVTEASSEGLAQHRLDGCEFDVAVFTNLSRDHLDFHGSMENYLAAKGLLFMLAGRSPYKGFEKAAIINCDDRSTDYLIGLTDLETITYGVGNPCDVRAANITAEGFSLRFTVHCDGVDHAADVPLIGRFNVYNSLIAIATARSQGIDVAEAIAALATFPGVPGRLERIEAGQPFSVYVDIASTPAALENVLTALRPGTRGRIWAVFGAAGGRDPARRDGMGAVAGRLADVSIVTNEDPRDEDPEAIIDAIVDGLRSSGAMESTHFFRKPDREEAIAFAFANAQPGDTVLLAGKATETTMIFGDRHLPWDERATAKRLLGVSG